MPERQIIVDAGPLVAALIQEDPYHAWALDQLQELSAPFMNCEPVLVEVFHLVRRLVNGPARFFKMLSLGLLVVDFDLMDHRKELAKLALKYADLPGPWPMSAWFE